MIEGGAFIIIIIVKTLFNNYTSFIVFYSNKERKMQAKVASIVNPRSVGVSTYFR